MSKFDPARLAGKTYDLAIIGGGPAGFALAALLGPSGLRILLADSAPPAPSLKSAAADTRTAALMGGSIDTLSAAGVWPKLKEYGTPLERMAVVDDSAFPAGADSMIEQVFDAGELGREAFGWNISLSALRAALYERIKTFKNVTVKFNTTITNFDALDAKLVVGCDGRNSRVRDWAGIAVKRRAYGQTAITCLIRHSRAHRNTSTEFHRPGGPFTIVPCANNTAAIVWVEKDDDARAFLKLPKAAFAQALQDRTRDFVGRIELIAAPASWPLEFLRADRLTGKRVALAAEAAHVISPIGAQGLNLSLRDVTTLAGIIENAAELGLDIGSPTVLERYERARKSDVISRSMTIDLVNQAVATDARGMRSLRRLALRALSLPGPWRKLVMKKGLAA
jgi:2-octaprenyl-6-methoxyphenol hydroxylase